VGDDDQSIYRFRGANIENILNFEKQYDNARTIRLEQNYRSTQNILDAANAVIRHNAGRKGKTLWTENGGGEKVGVRTVLNEQDEAAFVTGDILSAVGRGARFRDAAVLYRMNAQSNALEYAMKRSGVPYKVVGGMKFFDRAEVKDMLAYLCVLNNPLDDLRLRRIINSPARGIGGTTMDKVAALAEQQGASLYEICRNADLFPELKTPAKKLLQFADLIDGLRKAGGSLALPEFYDAVCEQTGYTQALRDKNDMESRGRLENVQELKSNILGFLDRQPEDATLSGFLNEIALYTDLDSLEGSDDCVTLMTIHAAKGLEFPLVYVVGMEEGVFPGSSAQYEEDELEEERRLCYVAMTRAKERLTLTHARQRMLYGKTASNRVSRFLEEAPEENLNWEGRDLRPGGTFGSSCAGGFYGGGDGSEGVRRPVYARPARPSYQESRRTAVSQTAAPSIALSKGDRIEHGVFGKGTVLSVQPMGGDALVQVDFEGAGQKKLMLKAAAKHLKKLDS
ncbi:ATP-dependent helicase, partial [uncultured Oscillibacter sp.]|uniref:ATP-dependent helicase n=1 Tax=uncultured Oscillibacter sp. TaxID=876091 RepID=UPI0026193AB6